MCGAMVRETTFGGSLEWFGAEVSGLDLYCSKLEMMYCGSVMYIYKGINRASLRAALEEIRVQASFVEYIIEYTYRVTNKMCFADP